MPKSKPHEDDDQPAGVDRPRVFVIHKNRTARVLYNLRLEMGGVLKSWAVPKGPSFDPAMKRMAMLSEDQPLDYAEFEGLLPAGKSGAGATIVWDRGTWVALEDPEAGWAKGKLLFELKGYKLSGVWTLVRMKNGDKEWLLIKERDAHVAEEGTKPIGQESILSGLTVEELQAGSAKTSEVLAEIEKLGAPKKKVRPIDQQVMLAETADQPFSRPGWIFELKYDGFRLLTAREDGEAIMFYRRGANATKTFPDLARALAKLPFENLMIDGEVVVLDDAARPSFQRLQKRVQLLRAIDIERAAVAFPATYYAFDLLSFEGYDLRNLPLVERKRLLKMIVPKAGPIRFSDHIVERGLEMYREVEKLRLEGLVAKKGSSAYRGGRSPDWMKIRVDHTGDFVIVGYTDAEGSRSGFGALHLALWDRDQLIYVGRAGSGFTDKELTAYTKALEKSRIDTPAFGGNIPHGGGQHYWVEPSMVCEVRYKEITEDGLLRQPVFMRMRDDKPMRECVYDASFHKRGEPAAAKEEVEPEAPAVGLSNVEKIFWPEEKYTKGDLLEYYREISPWLLPYLRDRPAVLTRYPDGIDGKNFFQKDAPPFVPGWIRTVRMWSESVSREIDYFVCDDLESLLFIANLATIPLHVWSSRVADIQHPDWCILDLDPKKAPFSSVVKVALAIRALCEDIELECFIKTSGSTGLHVLLPLGNQLTYEQSRSLGELMSKIIVEELPELATTTRAVGERGKRVYLDYLQNGHGRLLVSPLCVRPVAKALVSMPLEWSEVNQELDFTRFTIKTARARMEAMKIDPLARVMSVKPDLARVFAKLAARLAPWVKSK